MGGIARALPAIVEPVSEVPPLELPAALLPARLPEFGDIEVGWAMCRNTMCRNFGLLYQHPGRGGHVEGRDKLQVEAGQVVGLECEWCGAVTATNRPRLTIYAAGPAAAGAAPRIAPTSILVRESAPRAGSAKTSRFRWPAHHVRRQPPGRLFTHQSRIRNKSTMPSRQRRCGCGTGPPAPAVMAVESIRGAAAEPVHRAPSVRRPRCESARNWSSGQLLLQFRPQLLDRDTATYPAGEGDGRPPRPAGVVRLDHP